MIVIPIVTREPGMILKGFLRRLEKLEIGGGAETIQTTALLKLAKILRRVLDTGGDLLLFGLQ